MYYNIRSSCLSACQQARTTIFQEMCKNLLIFGVIPHGITVNFALAKLTSHVLRSLRAAPLASRPSCEAVPRTTFAAQIAHGAIVFGALASNLADAPYIVDYTPCELTLLRGGATHCICCANRSRSNRLRRPCKQACRCALHILYNTRDVLSIK